MNNLEEVLNKLRKDKNKEFLNLFLKISTVVLLISNLVLVIAFGVAYFNLSKKQQVVVGINQDGIPTENVVYKGSNMANLVNHKQFLTQLLNLVYDWNKDNYKKNIEKATNYMSSNLSNNYLDEIERGGFIEQVQEYEMTSSLTIQSINEDSLVEYKNGYMITVNALKLRITDFIDRSIPVEIDIAFRPTEITNSNIWGLEIFEIKERNI